MSIYTGIYFPDIFPQSLNLTARQNSSPFFFFVPKPPLGALKTPPKPRYQQQHGVKGYNPPLPPPRSPNLAFRKRGWGTRWGYHVFFWGGRGNGKGGKGILGHYTRRPFSFCPFSHPFYPCFSLVIEFSSVQFFPPSLLPVRARQTARIDR